MRRAEHQIRAEQMLKEEPEVKALWRQYAGSEGQKAVVLALIVALWWLGALPTLWAVGVVLVGLLGAIIASVLFRLELYRAVRGQER